jgi:glycosyltransferase involved in cell wall biosynthesis
LIRRGIYSKFIDGVIVTTELTQFWLLKANIRGKNKRIFMIPPPIDCDLFKPLRTKNDVRERFNIPQKNDYLIVYFGPINPIRFPIPNILKAIKLLKNDGLNISLLVIARGRGEWKFDRFWVKRINELALKMNLNGNIKAYIKVLKEKEKADLYNLANIIIFPHKGLRGAVDPPLALLEAMACGKIVIATKVQSIPKIIKHKVNGILLNTTDSTELAQAIKYVATSEEVAQISDNARRTILKQFSQDVVAKKLLNTYNNYFNGFGKQS